MAIELMDHEKVVYLPEVNSSCGHDLRPLARINIKGMSC